MWEEWTDLLPFWEKLTPAQRSRINARASRQRYEKGELVHQGGYDCQGVLLVLRGCLRTYMLSAEGREITLFHITKGEMCLLSASCILRPITFEVFVEAEEETEVMRIPADVMAAVSGENLYAENFLYKGIAGRFSDVMRALQQVLFMGVDKRLATFLLEESDRCGSPVLRITHEQIAREVGSAREVVTRMARQFARAGWITLARGSVTIVDKGALKGLLE